MHAPKGHAVNDHQREVAEELAAQDISVWMTRGTGKAIITAFRRYLGHDDSKHISQGLYRFLMMRMGFIAHFDLHNFRCVYRDPVAMLDELEESPEWRHTRLGANTQDVYTDGLTSAHVHHELRAIVGELGPAARKRSAQARAVAEVALAKGLAAKHGLAVTEPPPRPAAGAAATTEEGTT